jgi:hypothetical protein
VYSLGNPGYTWGGVVRITQGIRSTNGKPRFIRKSSIIATEEFFKAEKIYLKIYKIIMIIIYCNIDFKEEY